MFYLYFSLFNKNIHEVKNIAIRIVSCHTYRDTYHIVKMCIVTSLVYRRGPVDRRGPVTIGGPVYRRGGGLWTDGVL